MKEILSLVFQDTNVNFNRYKKSTLKRRIKKRIDALNLRNEQEYLRYLKNNQEEVFTLFNTMLIGVTEFFRDKEAFKVLKSKLAEIINTKKKGDNIRIWCVGCANGSEVYSVSILLHELLGDQINDYNVKIFGSDIHEKSIAFARKGEYTSHQLVSCPKKYIDKYFSRTSRGYKINEAVKKSIVFSIHDLTNDPPFLRLDIISCRNLLIYFEKELQNEAIASFHQCLNNDGFLFLGKSENVSDFQHLFHCVDTRNKIFKCTKRFEFPSYNYHKLVSTKKHSFTATLTKAETTRKSLAQLAKEVIMKTYDHPFIVVNDNMEILESEGPLRLYLEIKPDNPQNSLLKALNKEIRFELHNKFLLSKKNKLPTETDILRFKLFDHYHFVKCKIKPIQEDGSEKINFVIIFEKVETIVAESKDYSDLQNLSSDNDIIIALKEELQVANEHLETYRIELEKRAAEAQSLNEELQSANEELKSANEELETSNEELQALNEELFTSNSSLSDTNKKLMEKEAELLKSNEDLNQHKKHLEIAKNMDSYVSWEMDMTTGKTRGTKELLKLFGIEGKDEKYILGGDWIKNIHPEDREEFTKKFITTREHASKDTKHQYRLYRECDNKLLWLEVTAAPRGDKLISVVRDITEQKTSRIALEEEKERYKTLFNNTEFAILIVGIDNKIKLINDTAVQFLKHRKDHYIGKDVYNIDKERPGFLNKRIQEVLKNRKGGTFEDVINTTLGRKWFLSSIEPIIESDGTCNNVQIITYDISDKKIAEAKLEDNEKKLSIIFSHISENIVLTNVEEDDYYLQKSNNHFLETAKKLNDKLNYNEISPRGYNLKGVMHDILNLPESQYISTKESLDKVKRTKKTVHKVDEVPFPDGPHFLDTNYIPILDENNDCTQILITSRDITERIISERKVIESEEKLKVLLQNANESISILDENFHIKFVSSSHYKIFGRGEKELLGKKIGRKTHKEDLPVLQEYLNKSLRNPGRSFTFRVRVRHSDGHYIWIEGTARNLIHKPEINGIIINNRDITANVLAEQEIKESESRLKALDEASTEGIFFHANQKLIDCNSAFLKMMGYSTREEVAKLTMEETAGPFAQTILEKITSGYEGIYEAGLIRKNGELFPVEISSRNTYFNGAKGRITQIKDITERKKIERKLALQSAFLRNVLDTIPSFVFAKNKEGKFILANKALADEYKTTPKELIGKTDSDFNKNKALVKKYLDDDKAVIESLEKKFLIEEFTPYVGGEKKYMQVIKVPLVGENEEPMVLGVATNITNRVLAEKALLESETKFRAITEHTPYATLLFYRDMEIDYSSKETVKLLKEGVDKIIHKKITTYITEKSLFYFQKLLNNVEKTPDLSIPFDDLHIKDSLGEEYITDGFLIKLPKESGVDGYLLKMKDITLQRMEEVKRTTLNQTLLQLSNNKAIHSGDFESALRVITKTTAKIMKASRTSVWIYDEEQGGINLALMYLEKESKYVRSGHLIEKEHKKYFKKIREKRVVSIPDAMNDRVCKSFVDSYLKPNKIYSLLDAKFIYNGKFKGVICIEQEDNIRDWSLEEQNFVASLADLTTVIWQNHERSLVQAALTKSESEWKILVNNAPDIIFKVDNKKRINFINKYDRFYKLEEIIGAPFDQFSAQEFRPVMNKVVDNALKKGIIGSYETCAKLRNGEVKWYSSRVAPITVNGKILEALVYTSDITERKRVEMALKEGDIRYKSMIENSTEAIWRFEISPGISSKSSPEKQAHEIYKNSTIAEANSLTASLFGEDTIQKIIGKKLNDVLPISEDLDNAFITFCKDNYKASEIDFSIDFPNGRKYFSMYASGVTKNNKLTRVWGTFKDVTERKEAEFANERLLRVIEGSTDFVGMTTKEGKALYVNSAGRKLIGLPKDIDISRMSVSDFHNEEMTNYLFNVAYPHAEKYGTWEGTTTMTNRDGKDIPLSQLIIAHQNEGKDLLYFSTVARDMTANKLNNERMMQSVVKGVDNERQRIASELHDSLGQLLSAASINLESMKKDAQNFSPPTLNKYNTTLSLINNAIIETREISHDLMPKSLSDFGLITSLEAMIEKVEQAAPFEIQFSHFRVPENLNKELEINLYRITQEAMNNIIKHSNATLVTIQLIKHRDRLIYSIEDNGNGFDTAQNKVEGHGLNNIKNRVLSLGGDLNIYSSKKGGTTISVEVPLIA